MINVIIQKAKSGEYKGFTCQGHAGFDNKGRDIVCASISVLTINTVNALEQLAHEEMEVKEDTKKGSISCRFTGTVTEQGRLLMDSYVLGCKKIFQAYGDQYITLKFREV